MAKQIAEQTYDKCHQQRLVKEIKQADQSLEMLRKIAERISKNYKK